MIRSNVKTSTSESVMLSANLTNRSLDSIQLFHTHQSSITLSPDHNTTIDIEYVPLKRSPRQCCVLLHNRQFGDLVRLVSTSVSLPTPSPILPPFLQPSTVFDKEKRTLYIRAIVGEVVTETINITCDNQTFETAVYQLTEWKMPFHERERRLTTGSMNYTSLLSAMKSLHLDATGKTYWDHLNEGENQLHFDVSCDTKYFKLPSKLLVSPFEKNSITSLPIEFVCDTEGHYTCHIVLTSLHDVRVYCIEVVVSIKQEQAEIEFKIPAFERLTQRIPLVSNHYMYT